MSGHWEVVGKPKKTANGGKPKLSKTEKKKFIENAPKIEDILPLAQVKSLYTALDKVKKPVEKNEKAKEESKKTVQKKSEKPKEVISKPQKPKSIESALSMIDVEQVESVMTICQSRFADSPLIWLKEIATYLNSKLTVDISDPVFTNRPMDYPLSAVPGPLYKLLEKLISLAGSSNCQLFYELCLTNITNEMSKGSNALGYKLFAQLLAFSDPKACVANLAKCAIQRNSYQNRPPIGQSFLWALGKGGVKDLTVGFKVWLEIMVPVIDMKNYSKFVIEYLYTILEKHEPTAKNLSNDLFIQLFDVLNTPRPGLPKDLSKMLKSIKMSIKNIMFKDSKKGSNQNFRALFPLLLKRMDAKLPQDVKTEAAECLVKCLSCDPECFSVFQQNYTKSLLQSASLMEYISEHWQECQKTLGLKRMQNLVKIFQTTNEELCLSKKKEEGLQQSIRICHALLEKMSKKKETSLAWKITKAFLVVFLLLGLVVAYDVSTYKSFETSLHGQVLTKTGLLPLAEKAGDRFLVYSARGYKWAERNLPEYYNHTVVLAEPYLKLASETVLVGKNVAVDVYGNLRDIIGQKTPIVVDTINQYAPGLLDTIQTHSGNAWSTVSTYCSQYFEVGREYLKTKVFVGQLSPENLQKVTLDAFNTTQQYASQYYSWLYEKVNTYSKLQ